MKIIIIGSSTGGPYILENILKDFPILKVAIVIVQHLPPAFNKSFNSHIASLTKMGVFIIDDHTRLSERNVYIAAAGYHLRVENNRVFRLDSGEKVHGVRPAVDLTLLSIKKRSEDSIMGIILTGMGRDGADGLCYLHRIGGTTIAQDPLTAPIKSMPQAAIETGEVDYILVPELIREKMILFGQ
ncbi:MAG: chemotaxis protein CheB [Methanomicrobiales archaeon]|nr:chemotaxis protein CheB [Methanomicrobiales archaeon]